MNIGQLIVTMGCDTAGLDRARVAMLDFEKTTTKSINASAQRLRTFGYLATATLTVPIVMAGKAALKMASDYEYSMQKIVGLTGEAQGAVNQWSDSILNMAPGLARKPQELAEALYFISSSGIKGAQAMDVLKLSAKAATAGMGDTQQMANVLTSALKAYRGTGLTAAYATDVMVAAVREGKAEAAGFSTALGQIIPIAAQLGVSFDQVAGGMAAITLTGASSANAAVYLKGVFNSLLTASTQGEKALNSVGTSYAQLRKILSEQGVIPLMQKLRDIQTKYGDEILSDVLPNIRALTGYLSLAGKNFQYNTELMKRVTASTGSLGKAWAAVADTIKVRYDAAISSINVSMITLGKSLATELLPYLEKLTKMISNITKWFNSLSEAQKKHLIVFTAFVALIGPASLVISVLMYSLSGLVTVFTKLATGGIFLTNVIRGLTGSFGGMKAAMTANAALTKTLSRFLLNPWVLAGAAVVGVTVAVSKHIKKMHELAKEYDSFYLAAVKANGELTKLSGLTSGNISTMSVEELSNLQEVLIQEEAAAKAKYKQYEIQKNLKKGLDKLLGGQKSLQRMMDAETQKVLIIQQLKRETLGTLNQLLLNENSIGDTLEEQIAFKDQILLLAEEELKRIEKAHSALEEYNKELKEQTKEMGRQARLQLAQENTPVDYQKFFMRTSSYSAGTGGSAFMGDLEKELSKQAFMNSMVGDSYDVLSSQVDVYRKAIEELYDMDLYKTGNQAALDTMDQLQSKYKELSDQLKSAKLISDVAKDAIGNLSNAFSDLGSSIEGSAGKFFAWAGDVLKRLPEIIAMFAALKALKEANAQAALKEATANAVQSVSLTALLGPLGAVTAAEITKANASAGAAAAGGASSVANIPYVGPILAVAAVASIMAALLSIPKMANGGIVPGGYPNDTYPALLTSGERVIPPGKLDESQGGQGGYFDIYIHGDSRISNDQIVTAYDTRVRTKKKY
jgi:TP901 family phage tail tape measure protein